MEKLWFSQVLRRTGHGCVAPAAAELPAGLRGREFLGQLLLSQWNYRVPAKSFTSASGRAAWELGCFPLGIPAFPFCLGVAELVWKLLCHPASKELQVTGGKKNFLFSFLLFCCYFIIDYCYWLFLPWISGLWVAEVGRTWWWEQWSGSSPKHWASFLLFDKNLVWGLKETHWTLKKSSKKEMQLNNVFSDRISEPDFWSEALGLSFFTFLL